MGNGRLLSAVPVRNALFTTETGPFDAHRPTGSPDPGPHDTLDGWDQFRTVFTAPYLPNTLLSFYITHDSWHAVDTHAESGERRSLQYFICVDEAI